MGYWKAHPHQWGAGKTHVINDDGDKTLCGKPLSSVPGEYVEEEGFTCQSCVTVMLTAEKRRKQNELYEARRQEFAREQAERNREWHDRYDAYLHTVEWQQRKRLVLKRCNGICEACGRRPATEIHHLTYKHVCNEPLFELVGICRDCHEAITSMDRGYSND